MNNMGIKLALLYLFLLMMNIGYAQQKLEKELDSYTREIKIRVIQKLESDYRNKKYLKSIQKGNFVCIPYCDFNSSKIIEDVNDFNLITIRKDTTGLGFRVNLSNDSLFVIPNYIAWDGLISRVDESDYNDPLLLMSQYAIKFSKYFFALRIRNIYENRPGFLIVCYLKQDKLRVLVFNGWDTNGKIIIAEYDAIESYINHQYGGLLSYKVKVYEDSAEQARYLTDVKYPRQILRKSYFYYEKCFAADSLVALHAMLVEMDSMIHFAKGQSDSLEKEILSSLKNSPLATGSDSVEFWGKDVSAVLNKVLNNEQFTEYKKKYLLKRSYESELFDTLVEAYEYWDYGNHDEKENDTGSRQSNLLSFLQKKALIYIFSDDPPN